MVEHITISSGCESVVSNCLDKLEGEINELVGTVHSDGSMEEFNRVSIIHTARAQMYLIRLIRRITGREE